MIRKFYGLLIFILCTSSLFSQVIKGKVTDAESGKTLSFVSVFINNSSIGTTTDAEGNFTIASPSSQRFEIITSYVGYETHTTSISPENSTRFLNIKLKQKSAELEQVIVSSYEKDGWTKWGKVFLENIIGTTPSAEHCKLKNSKAVRFIYNKKEQVLTAYASEPLQIENKYLGYNLVYDLQSFRFDYKNRIFFFSGYPFFTNLKGSSRKIEKWEKHRRYAYEGSLMHFMRALYRNKVQEAGFTMNVLQRFPNKEKARVKALYKNRLNINGNNVISISADSSEYFNSILAQSDSMDYVQKNTLPADSIAYGYDSTTAVLEFKNHLQVTFEKKKEMPSKALDHHYEIARPVSIFNFVNTGLVFVYSDGSYFEPNNILTEGYWAWSEKLSNLLPTDYKYNE